MRYTPDKISSIKPDEVFVFGSNEAGIHGAGAALLASDRFGAKRGQGFGWAGNTFAIPTKDWDIQTLQLDVIGFYVRRFLAAARYFDKRTFLVTKIGCGLAGYTPAEIAPLFFVDGEPPKNVILHREFWDHIWNIS